MAQGNIRKNRRNSPNTNPISTRPKWDAYIAVREATAGALQALGVMASFVIFGLTFGLSWALIAGASPYDGPDVRRHHSAGHAAGHAASHAASHALDHGRAGAGLVESTWTSYRSIHSGNHDSRAKTESFSTQLASSDRGQR
jgi:hypothetical protein